ncbi:MAG: PEP-CTERM sorting domain-containing protein [Verrucomicrobia bacterium]|nr:PEP-CTERM sorting domain-containing protein [Verrucomicrobiota bacterium]
MNFPCRLSLCALALTLGVAAASAQTIYVNETFDGYVSTADMQANWGSAGLGTLSTDFGNPANSGNHPGGAVNTWIGSTFAITPSDAQPIVLTADIYDDATSVSERLTVGLRNGANPMFEMGHYQTVPDFYAVRILAFAGNENWVPISAGLLASSGQPAGWNRYQATFTSTGLTVTLDLGIDGIIDGTFTSTGVAPVNPFVDLRFGGPSGVSSAGGGAYFDNISLVVVPEPSMAALAALGLLGFGTMVLRRRQS